MKCNLFIFIHGIGSDQSTWDQYINVLKNDPNFHLIPESAHIGQDSSHTIYSFYNYDSPIVNKPTFWSSTSKYFRSKQKGEKAAGDIPILSFAEALKVHIDQRKEKYDKIFIFAHSMGGLIALEYIFLVMKNEQAFLEKNFKFVLFGSPLSGSGDSKDIKTFFDNSLTKNVFSYAVKELSPESVTITSLKSKIAKNIGNLQKLYILYLYGILDNRIVEESKTIAEGFCKKIASLQNNHSTIKEPKNADDPSYSIPIDFVKEKIELLNFMSPIELSTAHLFKWWSAQESSFTTKFPFLIEQSFYTITLYAHSVVLSQNKYHVRMMKDGNFKIKHFFRPFDKQVQDPIQNDPFFQNFAGNRFTEKSCNIIIMPDTLPIDYKLKYYLDQDDQSEWVMIDFSSRLLSKDTTFTIEFSFSDIVDLKNTEDAKRRREEYFESKWKGDLPHAYREIKYQIETYTDKQNQNVALPFEPWLKNDGIEIKNKNNCSKNIFYKSWTWGFYYPVSSSNNISIQLRESESLIKQGAPCTYI